jgi:hypothetical protein
MTQGSHGDGRQERPLRSTYQVRLPGFVSDKPVGLGDTIKRATSRVGIGPCTGCQRRARQLNSWVSFSKRT